QVIGRIEAANGGTLFLDEIGDLPAALQAKLLRFLQDQTFERVGGRAPIRVDVRVVSATNQPLEDQATEGRFRGDLLYRLNGVTIRIPPLRERGEDALLLARWFLAREGLALGRKNRGFDAGALAAIAGHSWPGNVRELQNRVRRAVLMADGPLITAEDLELAAPAPLPRAPMLEENGDEVFDLRTTRLRAEREAIERALLRSKGSVAGAARLLGVSRPTLYGLLETHGMAISRQGPDGQSPDGAEPPEATLDAV
nr:sigma 54-interacting transcriptional regulator [Acetobacteraceae bacterium]